MFEFSKGKWWKETYGSHISAHLSRANNLHQLNLAVKESLPSLIFLQNLLYVGYLQTTLFKKISPSLGLDMQQKESREKLSKTP